MSKFTEYKLDITPKNKKLISEYLGNTKTFISDNALEEDLYFDIEERVFEKLAEQEKLTELIIKQTLHEIGNPQDIFEVEEKSHKKKTWFSKVQSKFQKITKNKFLVSFLAIVFLAIVFRPPMGLVMTAFFIWFVTWLVKSFIQYSQKNEGKINIFGSLVFIIKKIINIVKSLFSFIKKSIINIVSFIKYLIYFIASNAKKIFKLIVKVATFMFNFISSFIGYALIALALLLFFVVPILYMGFELGNVNYSSFVPYQLMIGYLFALLGLISLGIYCVMKKHFLVYFIISGSSVALAVSFIFLGTTQLYNAHAHKVVSTQEYELELESDILHINKYNLDLYGNNYFSPIVFDGYSIRLKVSQSEKFNFKIINTFYTNTQESGENYVEKLSEYKLIQNNGSVELLLEAGQVFAQEVDFVPLEKTLEIYIPQGKELDIENFWYSDFGYSNLFDECRNDIYQVRDNQVVCSNSIDNIIDEVLLEADILLELELETDTGIKNSVNVPKCEENGSEIAQCAE